MKLLDQVRDVIREKYYSIRTEQLELIEWNTIYYSTENVTQKIWEKAFKIGYHKGYNFQ